MFRKKKKKEEVQKKDFKIDFSKVSLKLDKYLDPLGRFIMEHLPNTEITKEGNVLHAKVPVEVSKRMLNLRVEKFLYQSGLKTSCKLVAVPDGYMVYELK
jgi:hypothetical protein